MKCVNHQNILEHDIQKSLQHSSLARLYLQVALSSSFEAPLLQGNYGVFNKHEKNSITHKTL